MTTENKYETIDEVFERVTVGGKRETTAANEAFQAYVRLGVKRSLRNLQTAFEEQAAAVASGDSDKLPPTTNLKSIAGWSSDFNWTERAEAYDEFIRQERRLADEADRLEERNLRRGILSKLRKQVDDLIDAVDTADDFNVKQFNSMVNSIRVYMDQSRAEWNDMPNQVFDVTSGGQPLKVNFITEVIPQSEVNDRLRKLGLDHYVDEHTDGDFTYDAKRLEASLEA